MHRYKDLKHITFLCLKAVCQSFTRISTCLSAYRAWPPSPPFEIVLAAGISFALSSTQDVGLLVILRARVQTSVGPHVFASITAPNGEAAISLLLAPSEGLITCSWNAQEQDQGFVRSSALYDGEWHAVVMKWSQNSALKLRIDGETVTPRKARNRRDSGLAQSSSLSEDTTDACLKISQPLTSQEGTSDSDMQLELDVAQVLLVHGV